MFKNIRFAQEKDIEKLVDLLHQIREFHCDFRPDIFKRGCTKYSSEELKNVIKDENREIYVAVDENDNAIGHLFLTIKNIDHPEHVARKELYIDDICVDENIRNSGIGRAFMEFAEKRARALGCDFLTLNSWAGNDSAEHLYKSCGMTPRVTSLEKKLK